MARPPRLRGLAAAVAVVAAACSGGGAPPGSSPPAPDAATRLRSCDAAPGPGEVGLTVWHSESGRREQVLLDLVARFERAEPTADVTVERVDGGHGVLLERWREAGPAERPSLALVPRQYTRRLADSGQTMAPGRCLREAVPGVLPAVEAGWSVDGTVRAVPFAVSTPVLLYNRRVFAAAGLDPDDPPASLDDLRRVSERVVGTGAAVHGLVFDTGSESGAAWFVEQWNAQAGALSLAPDNGRRRPATTAAWRDGPTVDHLRWLRTMVDDGLAVTVGRNAGGIDHLLRAVEAESPAAMTLHTCASLAEVLDVVATGQLPQLDLGVAPFPGPGTGSLPGGSASGLPVEIAITGDGQPLWTQPVQVGQPQAISLDVTGILRLKVTATRQFDDETGCSEVFAALGDPVLE